MKITEKIKFEILQVMKDYWESYLRGDFQNWASYLPDNYGNIGTTKEEIWSNKKEILDYTEKISKQVTGTAEIRNKRTQFIPYDPYIMIHEVGDMFVKADEGWLFYAQVRLSSLLEKTINGWKILHQHGSYPDSKADTGEAYGFDELKIENKKLKDAIQRRTIELERQNRDLEIEAALERVRSRTMAMQRSDELSEAATLVLQELKELGIELQTFGFIVFDRKKKAGTVWLTPDGKVVKEAFTFPVMEDATFSRIYQAWEDEKEYYIADLSGANLTEHLDYVAKYMPVRELIKRSVAPNPERIVINALFYSQGFLGINTSQSVEKELPVLQRFSKVFDQTFTRFLDLQKAEKQAREAMIEAGLERVRAASMAMNKSEDLPGVLGILFEQLQKLSFDNFNAFIIIFNEEENNYKQWSQSYGGFAFPDEFIVPIIDHPLHTTLLKEWKEGLDFSIINFTGKEIETFHEFFFDLPEIREAPQELKEKLASLEEVYFSISYLKYGAIIVDGLKPLDGEKANILMRFANVLDLTYTRMLDLQNAEARTREAQIDAALEKIRSRSLAVTKTDEFNEVVEAVFEKLSELRLPVSSVTIGTNIDNSKDRVVYGCGESEAGLASLKFKLPYFPNAFIDDIFQEQNNSITGYLSKVYTKEEKDHYYNYAFENTELKHLPEDLKEQVRNSKSYGLSTAFARNSSIMVNDFEGNILDEDQADILKRFSRVFEQAYVRFLDIQHAEHQNREAQINLALERVRARTMAMHKSEELADISFELFKQIQSLGIETWHCAFNIYDVDQESSTEWGTNTGGVYPRYKTPREGIFKKYYEIGQSGERLHVEVIGEDRCQGHYAWLCTLPGVGEQLVELRDSGVAFPTSQIDHVAYFKYGYLIFITYDPVPESHHIFIRFAKIFEQAYIRFLDLQKAEAQVKEAQIEAALEKVRSQTMAMHKADELRGVVTVVVEKLIDLGVILDANGVILCTYFTDSKDVLHWIASPDFSFTGSYLLPYFDHPIFSAAWESRLNGDEYFSKSFSVEEKNSFFEYAFEHSDYRHFPDEFKEWVFQNDKHSLSFAWSENSAILIPSHTGIVPEGENIDIIKRFAKVFEQAYVRFMDLQRSEKAARKTQIELSLEKIRALVASMQESSDLLDIVVAMRKEFIALGHEAHYFWYMRWLPKIYEKAMTSGDGTKIGFVMTLPRKIHGEIKHLAEWEKGQDSTVIHVMDVDAAIDYVHKMIEWGDFLQVDPNVPSDDDIRHIGGLTYVMARTTQGEIGYSLPGMVPNPPQEAVDTLVRFARVFDLAYTRFEDLKEAEAKKREAEIELALEKVRTRTMEMEHSQELPEAANSLFLQVQALGIPAWSAGYCIWDNEDKTSATAFMSSEGVLQKPFSLPAEGVGYNFYDPLIRGKSFHVEELGGEELVKHYEFMRTLPIFGEVIDGIMEAGFALPTFQIFHIVYFPHGYLMFITYEAVPHAYDIFKRFAKVFEQTYTRFLDLQTKEEQSVKIRLEKERLEKTLDELKAAQEQLIQAEKMASLGELTAGIAHEIQNPLNFVNNFSEVSSELLEELEEELENGDMDEVKVISKDLKSNLNKITEHGKRADSIVKGMLLHSRNSKGEKILTDINALCDEFLRLSYHGMRARNRNFNADFELDLDPDVPKIKIVSQDIGRVLLNLINNAFQALSADNGKRITENGKVTLTTKNQGDKIEITISDNGPGIPDDIKDKIFQPFFTTKPTGQGTGLGLSLSYDIVKAHGGEIRLQQNPIRGSIFIISLPIQP